MLKASRKNRVLRIPDEKAKEYIALGYTVTAMNGKLVGEPENAAKKARELAEANAELRAENDALKAELAEFKAKADKAKKPAAKSSAAKAE